MYFELYISGVCITRTDPKNSKDPNRTCKSGRVVWVLRVGSGRVGLKLLMFDRGIRTRIGGTMSVFLQNIYNFNLGK